MFDCDFDELTRFIESLTYEQVSVIHILMKLILYSSDADKERLFNDLEKRIYS